MISFIVNLQTSEHNYIYQGKLSLKKKMFSTYVILPDRISIGCYTANSDTVLWATSFTTWRDQAFLREKNHLYFLQLELWAELSLTIFSWQIIYSLLIT